MSFVLFKAFYVKKCEGNRGWSVHVEKRENFGQKTVWNAKTIHFFNSLPEFLFFYFFNFLLFKYKPLDLFVILYILHSMLQFC